MAPFFICKGKREPMNVQKKYRVAVVGCGMMAQAAHLPNCKSNPRIDLVAVCDLNEAEIREYRGNFHTPGRPAIAPSCRQNSFIRPTAGSA